MKVNKWHKKKLTIGGMKVAFGRVDQIACAAIASACSVLFAMGAIETLIRAFPLGRNFRRVHIPP